jgi:hypothetical protein
MRQDARRVIGKAALVIAFAVAAAMGYRVSASQAMEAFCPGNDYCYTASGCSAWALSPVSWT